MSEPGFSLVAGGPFYRLCMRLRLLRQPIERADRRAWALVALTWLPLLLLVAAAGASGTLRSFFLDAETHVRLLIALPVMILAERLVQDRQASVPEQLVGRGLVEPGSRPALDAALAAATRLRDSGAELLLLAGVFALDVSWRERAFGLRGNGWAAAAHGGISPAGWWYIAVSIPLYQFLLARWLLRFFIWTRFLWRVSRLPLRLIPAHPDKAAGLGFLEAAAAAFWPVLFAQSALLAAITAMRAVQTGSHAISYDAAVGAILAAGIVLIIGPLLFFSGRIAAAQRRAKREYSELADERIRRFDARWVAGQAAAPDAPLEGEELRSLAALGASFDMVAMARLVPFSLQSLMRLAVVVTLPWVPASLLSGETLQAGKLLLKMLF